MTQSDETSDDEEDVLERGLVVPQESVWERISALKDIIPPSTRQSIASNLSRASSYGSFTLLVGGKLAWVVTTTALLWGLPYALAVEDEMRISQQERDMLSQQQGSQQVRGELSLCLHALTPCLFPISDDGPARKCPRSAGKCSLAGDPSARFLMRPCVCSVQYKATTPLSARTISCV